MSLLNVETKSKDSCLLKLAKSDIFIVKINIFYLFISKGYDSICGIDLWTSGSNFGTEEYVWCSKRKPFKSSDLNWKSGQPKAEGDCVSLQLSNQSLTFSLGNCAEERFFTCEVKLLKKYYF